MGHPVEIESTGNGRNSWSRPKTASFAGWHEPDKVRGLSPVFTRCPKKQLRESVIEIYPEFGHEGQGRCHADPKAVGSLVTAKWRGDLPTP